MNILNKSLLSLALTASLGIVSNSAMAFSIFQVQEGAITGAIPNVITADKINGTFNEVVTITSATTFSTSLEVKFQGFADTTNPANDTTGQLGNVTANQYGLYLLYTSVGTFAPSGSGFQYTTTGALFNLYADLITNPLASATQLTAPVGPLSSTLALIDTWTRTNAADDQLLASGNLISGAATQTCSGSAPNNNCGSFGQTTTFNLTPLGSSYFFNPSPFFTISMQSGNFNGFVPTVNTTQTISGVANAVFNNVPEPSSLALLGIGTLLLGTCTKRRHSA